MIAPGAPAFRALYTRGRTAATMAPVGVAAVIMAAAAATEMMMVQPAAAAGPVLETP